MKTEHQTLFSDARQMKELHDESVDFVVTSPPYPMIEMWDDLFCRQAASVGKQLKKGDGPGAYESMHAILDATWGEVYRVLKPGRFACINIGDATRTLCDEFSLYTNHARILRSVQALGFVSLPCILWRKQTNAPNKFMGSGMLPSGAYVTLEHEYILVLRKGSKRVFKTEADKKNRRASAFFWEERNLWFSDIWFDIKGTPQALGDKDTRARSAAYPFELAYRLINMYSVKGDLVLDPYLGMGTTALAAMASGRNSVGYEIESAFRAVQHRIRHAVIDVSRQVIRQRFISHLEFIRQRMASKGKLKHTSARYGFPVMTAQEKEMLINDPVSIEIPEQDRSVVVYSSDAQPEFCRNWPEVFREDALSSLVEELKTREPAEKFRQAALF